MPFLVYNVKCRVMITFLLPSAILDKSFTLGNLRASSYYPRLITILLTLGIAHASIALPSLNR